MLFNNYCSSRVVEHIRQSKDQQTTQRLAGQRHTVLVDVFGTLYGSVNSGIYTVDLTNAQTSFVLDRVWVDGGKKSLPNRLKELGVEDQL